VRFCPRRDKIATGSFDKTCKLWSAESGTCFHTFRGHTGEIICLTFDPQSTLLASGGIDGTARLWSVEHGTEQATLAVSQAGRHRNHTCMQTSCMCVRCLVMTATLGLKLYPIPCTC
jgi:WD40 repeat protein